MPAYGFSKQFVPMILDKSKIQTIRGSRKNPTKPGDLLYLYSGLRTKSCYKVAEARCIDITSIAIWPYKKHLISPININIEEFVRLDGFQDTDSFFDFFKVYKRECLNDFEIIRWDPASLVPFV